MSERDRGRSRRDRDYRDRDRERDRDLDRPRDRERRRDEDDRDRDRKERDRSKRSRTPDRNRSRRRSHTRSRSPDRSGRRHHRTPSPDHPRKRHKREDSEDKEKKRASDFVDSIAKERKNNRKRDDNSGEPGDEGDGVVDGDEIETMKMMGIPVGFDSTKGKHVPGTDLSGVRAVTKRQPRQYMNRRGGFNRPLPAETNR